MYRAVFYLLWCTATLAWASEYIGPDVIERATYLTIDGRRSLILHDLVVSAGYLQAFQVYVHPFPAGRSLPRLRLQVWGEEQDSATAMLSFQLKWEMTADLTLGSGRKYEFPVPSGEVVYVGPTDYIGMTSDGNLNPVTYDFVEDREAFFRHVIDDELPEVGERYNFDPIPYPAVFSIGVNITQEMPMPSSEGSLVYFGNALYQRSGLDPPDVRRSWIDGVVVPEAGLLVTYHLFAGDFGEGNPFVRLQIWTVVETGSSAEFMLKWENRVQLTRGGNRPYTFTVPVAQSVYVTSMDRIGFTFDDVLATIPSSFSGAHKSYMLELPGTQGPDISETYTFANLPMPRMYSVGVTVDTYASPPQTTPSSSETSAEEGSTIEVRPRQVEPAVEGVLDGTDFDPFSSASSLCINIFLALAPVFVLGIIS